MRKAGFGFLLVLVIPLILVGVTLLIIAYNNSDNHLTHDITRDIGIAFLISALVTVAYETYARTRFDLAKIESLLDTVFGSGIPAKVWESIKETLLKRELIRCNTELRVSVVRGEAVADSSNVILDIDLAYDLASLLPISKDFTIIHGLDEHITASYLPRFLEASIDDHSEVINKSTEWGATDQIMMVDRGRLYMKVNLPAASENVTRHFRVRREEVRSCPGSYYFIMTELTEGIRVHLGDCAEDVEVTLGLRPSEDTVDLTAKRIAVINEPLLPGYGLEFKLKSRSMSEQNHSLEQTHSGASVTNEGVMPAR
jgi:hypothetical protein